MISLRRNRGFSTSSWCCAGAAAAKPNVGSRADSTASEAAKMNEDRRTMSYLCRSGKIRAEKMAACDREGWLKLVLTPGIISSGNTRVGLERALTVRIWINE